jgi:DNA-binding transcriptional ArsR family regulator
MESLLITLGEDLRIRVVRTLLERPGQRHKELLTAVGLEPSAKGTLTKAIGPLEREGLVHRADEQYALVDADGMRRLLAAAAHLNASAAEVRLRRAQQEVADARDQAGAFDS